MAKIGPSRGWVISALVSLVSAGCGGDDGRVPVVKTTGRLEWPGQSVVGLMVALHPSDPGAPKLPAQPTGIVQADGSFAITCYEVTDGAPPGEYIVTVRAAPQADDAPKPKLPPPKYRDPKTSPLRATIEDKPVNELPPLTITH